MKLVLFLIFCSALVGAQTALENDLKNLENDVAKIESEERNDLATPEQPVEPPPADDDASLTPASEQLTAPLLPTSGPEGGNNGPCKQGMRGRCQPAAQCDLNGGYRLAPGFCDGSNVCCLPKNAGGQNDILPAVLFERERFCFPLKQNSFQSTGSDYGSGRPRSSGSNRNKRCHSGQDIFSRSPGTVVAIDDGEVINIIRVFLSCNSGWAGAGDAGAVFVYHPALGRTVNYGEIDTGHIKVTVGSRVTKGQVIGRAGHCGMAHIEFYAGRMVSNLKWWSSPACKAAADRGQMYQCPTPSYAAENNMCAKYALNLKDPRNLDPRPYLDNLHPSAYGKWC